jgi:alpha-tubulin suppressor-like RCC1 family protein
VDALSSAGEVVVGLACGDGQTIAVSTEGRIWGWGCYKDKEGKKWFNPETEAKNPVDDIKKQQNTPLLIQVLCMPDSGSWESNDSANIRCHDNF